MSRAISDENNSSQGYGLVVYGQEGVGKTSFACRAERVVVLPSVLDHGAHKLKRSGLIPKDVIIGPDTEEFQETLDFLDELAEGYEDDHDRKTVVVDYVGGIQKQAFAHCCALDYENNWGNDGFMAFQKGPITTGQLYWPEFIQKLTMLQGVGMNVILVTHAKTEIYKNPEGEDYDRFVADLHDFNSSGAIKGDSIRKATYRWADNILFLKHSIDVVKEDKKGARAKGEGGSERIICTTLTATYDAKNRERELDSILGPFASADDAWQGWEEATNPKPKATPAKKFTRTK